MRDKIYHQIAAAKALGSAETAETPETADAPTPVAMIEDSRDFSG